LEDISGIGGIYFWDRGDMDVKNTSGEVRGGGCLVTKHDDVHVRKY